MFRRISNFTRKNKNRLALKIPLFAVSTVFLVIVTICIFLGSYLYSSKEEAAVTEINYIANNNAYLASSYLNNMQTMSQFLSFEINRYEVLNDDTRSMMIKKTLDSFLDDERIYSAYVALEPDTLYNNTPNGISFQAYRDGTSNTVNVKSNYSSYKDKDYYIATKKSKKAYLTEPYKEKLPNGKEVCLITISNPVLNGNGDFIGVANTDVLADVINGLNYNMGVYDTSYNYILTSDLHFVADTSKKNSVGSAYDKKDNSLLFTVSQPLEISGISNTWISTFSVEKSEVLHETKIILLFISIFSLLAIIIICLVIFKILHKSLAPINSIMVLSQNMKEGNLDSDITVNTNDELGELARMFKETSDRLSGYIHEISSVLSKLAQGDLRASVKMGYVGDFIPIKNSLGKIIEFLNKSFSEIGTVSQQVTNGIKEISYDTQVLSDGAVRQVSSLKELSSSANEVLQHATENSASANRAGIFAKDAKEALDAGKRTMGETIDAMDKIKISSEEITKIIKTINYIAMETNILSLNASVEAAKAGNFGSEFAVVAGEIRKLATQSKEAAKQTEELVKGSESAVADGINKMMKTAELLNSIINKFSEMNTFVADIAEASNKQADSIREVNNGITQIYSVVQTNSEAVKKSVSAVKGLSFQSEVLLHKVSMFKLK